MNLYINELITSGLPINGTSPNILYSHELVNVIALNKYV